MAYTKKFVELVEKLVASEEKPGLHSALVAQWMLESARGSSLLAKEHNNFAGIKWRKEMKPFAKKQLVEAPSETAYFCKFETLEDFLNGYWAFLERDPYKGWRKTKKDSEAFITHIGPVWAQDPTYVEKVIDLFAEADLFLESLNAPCCDGMVGEDIAALAITKIKKPKVRWDPTPFYSSRNGSKIEYIVMHYTTSRNIGGTISWFKNPNRKHLTAAHYIIGRDGQIVQMVKDKHQCKHGNSKNRNSIGIEHSAAPGDKFTKAQEESSVRLIKWLIKEYGIEHKNIIPHKCTPRDTSCPGELFSDYGVNNKSNCDRYYKAVQAWVAEKIGALSLPIS